MPLIQITLLKGRTTEQKRRIAQRMTDVLVEEAKTAKEGVVVTFVDVEKDSYARGGELMLIRRRYTGAERSPLTLSGKFRHPRRRYCKKGGAFRWRSKAASSLIWFEKNNSAGPCLWPF